MTIDNERLQEIRREGNGNEFTLHDMKEELLVELDSLRKACQVAADALSFYKECGEYWLAWSHDSDGDPDGAVVLFTEEAGKKLKQDATEALQALLAAGIEPGEK